MGKVFPQGSGFKQTIEGRRRRLRESLIQALNRMGWQHLGRNTFERVPRHETGADFKEER
jgi:hypothetical protein